MILESTKQQTLRKLKRKDLDLIGREIIEIINKLDLQN